MGATPRSVIMNADDFGQSVGINRGVIVAHEHGIVTSASLMVRWPAAAAAAAYARAHPELSLGIHVDLGEWVHRDDTWTPLYTVVPMDDERAVAAEVRRQLATFRRLVGKDPTHLDSHQHVHLREPARAPMIDVARELGVPLRRVSAGVRHCGDFYGQTETGTPFPEGISLARLLGILRALPPGVTELSCHPGEGDDLTTMYRAERATEVRVLCDPDLRAAMAAAGIALCSFSDVAPSAAALPGTPKPDEDEPAPWLEPVAPTEPAQAGAGPAAGGLEGRRPR